MPAVERILKLWTPLKHYFDTEEKVPKIISDFFKSPISEIYFLFLHSNLNLFEKNIKSVEKNKVSVIEIRKILYETQNTLIERKSTKFIGFQTKMKMQKLKNENPTPETTILIAKFEEETLLFFNTASEYLKKWSDSFYKYKVFDWMTLSEIPEWEKIENTILYLNNIGVEILSDNLFEQYIYLKNFLEVKLASEEWKSINLVEEKWIYFFNETKNHERKCQLLKLCEYLFAIPAHNATVERVFSLMSAQWTDERNRLLPETMESILQCQINYNMTCQEFYQYIKGEKELLKKAKSSENACSNELRDWLNKKKSSTPFAIPMVWREQKDYYSDCYFCNVNVNGFSKKNKHIINYPNLDFAIRPVKHSASLSIPIPPEEGLNLNIEMECDQDSSDHHDECPEDADYTPDEDNTPDEDKSSLQTFSQDELNDLIRDLSLSKEKAEFLASRLKQKNLL
ncbi:hypothetical protein QTP88_000580 [Uroleucon formosanum]